MINLNKMWINVVDVRKTKRHIKELNFEDIDIKEYRIVDVRSKREFMENHLNGSINIPLPEIKNNVERYVKNKQQKILVCCQYGVRSKKAAEQLENMGYVNVYNLKGGLENI